MSKMWEPPADFGKVIGARSHFIIEQRGGAWAVIIHRRGSQAETILAKTEGEANQIRMKLSEGGLIGFMGGRTI